MSVVVVHPSIDKHPVCCGHKTSRDGESAKMHRMPSIEQYVRKPDMPVATDYCSVPHVRYDGALLILGYVVVVVVITFSTESRSLWSRQVLEPGKIRESLFNPFSTAAPIWGQTTRNLSALSPKRDCSSKRVEMTKLGWESRHSPPKNTRGEEDANKIKSVCKLNFSMTWPGILLSV